jgi:hypothetical protein
MKQIIRNPDFRAAFDIQLDVPGLGGGMSLGSTHKMFGMKCHEVRLAPNGCVDVLTFQLMLSYLDDSIRGFWTKIFQGDKRAMLKVNRADVKALELKAPGACRLDRVSLYRQLRDGEIFGAFTDREREAIWTEILSETTDRLVPSLSSFFADVNYLKGPADCVKTLVELWPDDTVSSALERIFSDANQETDRCVIQHSESTFTSIPGNKSDRLELGVLQIWIGAMRDFLEMLPEKDDDNLVAKPRSQPHERIGCEFASLAYRLGFESEEIHHRIQCSPDEEIARKALLKARDPNRYKYDDTAFANFVEQMVRFFSTAEKKEDETMMDFEGHPRALKRKGIPQTGIYRADKSSLYLKRLYSTCEDQSDEVTSFFVRRSVYFAFFGKPSRATRERVERLIREEQGKLTEQNREEQEESRAQIVREEQGRLDQERREEQETLEQERQKQRRQKFEQERLEQERQKLEQETLEHERQKFEQETLARMEQKRNKKTKERGNQQPNQVRGRGIRNKLQARLLQFKKNRKRTTRSGFNNVTETMTQETVESSDSTSVPQLELPTSQVQGDSGKQTIPIGDHNDLPAVAGDSSTSTSSLKTPTQRPVDIHFKIRDYGKWRLLQTLSVDPSDTSELERFVVKYMRKHDPIYTYTKDERMVMVGTCFEDAIADGENTLYLIPKWELNNGNDSNGNSSNGNGSNENDSEVPQSARKILKLS